MDLPHLYYGYAQQYGKDTINNVNYIRKYKLSYM